MTGAVECRYYGRNFTAREMALLRALVAGPAQLSRRALSIGFCRRIGWPVAMPGFSTAAWKLAARDNFIGWTPEKREKNLPLVIDNPRFLILPWIEIPTSARTSSPSSADACPPTGPSAAISPPC